MGAPYFMALSAIKTVKFRPFFALERHKNDFPL